MKNIKSNRKLSLTTETLKTLNPAELDGANGGILVDIEPLACGERDEARAATSGVRHLDGGPRRSGGDGAGLRSAEGALIWSTVTRGSEVVVDNSDRAWLVVCVMFVSSRSSTSSCCPVGATCWDAIA